MSAPDRLVVQQNTDFSRNRALVNWRDRLASLSSDTMIQGFYEFAASAVTLVDDGGTSRVSAIDDWRTGYGNLATAGSAALRPAYQPTGGPNGRPAALFDTGDKVTLPSAESKPTGDHWLAALFYAPISGQQTLIGTSSADTGRHQLRLLSSGVMVGNTGTDGVEASPNVPYPASTWCLGIKSWRHSTKTARVRLFSPGLDLYDENTSASAVLGTGDMYIGDNIANGKIGFVALGWTDLLAQDTWYKELMLRSLLDYCADRYGLIF